MKRISILYVLCGFVLAGCGNKEVDTTENDVFVYISTNPLSDLGKSATTMEENLISKFLLYGVNDKNVVVKTFPAITDPPLDGIQLIIPKEVKTLYAIANPSAGIENVNPSSLSGLLNLTGDFTTVPVSPFLMSGKGDVTGSNVSIVLTRAVAKIEVIAHNEFVIESVTVKNTPDKGYVFKKETIAAPTSSRRVDYSANTTNSIVYVAENSKNSPTELVVSGTYLNKRASYTIVLKNNLAPIDIARNTYYKVNISAITDSECTVSITILVWDVKETDDHIIPDENF